MGTRLTATLAFLLAAGCTSDKPAAHPWVVSMSAVGPISFGMTPAEAATALKAPPLVALPDSGCAYWTPRGAPPGLSLMIENGRIVRVDVDSAGIETDQGLHVGSTASEVRSALKSATDQPHKYRSDDGWRYLSTISPDSVRALIFEVDSTSVRTFRAGLWPAVAYVERCG